MGHRRGIGRPLNVLDGQITSIARAHSLAIATRNTHDFEDCGLELMNPFSDPPDLRAKTMCPVAE